MALELKRACEKCGVMLTSDGVAYICSYECTYCANCAEQINAICPNCGGELVRRPRRQEQSGFSVATSAEATNASAPEFRGPVPSEAP
jgi:hypothetical protein